uniref:Signal recognition particle receptor subunit beta n=1 Tax=Populus alba TaxID=43335 RepID=A0A4V6AAD2_POPAL|nr:hypothetical protein D5086_0000086320 [Populus alba]
MSVGTCTPHAPERATSSGDKDRRSSSDCNPSKQRRNPRNGPSSTPVPLRVSGEPHSLQTHFSLASKMEGIEQWKTEAQQWLQQGIEYAHQIPPTQLYAAVAVLLFTTLLLFTIRLLKRTKSNTIVLSGLSGSGKTVLFYQLRDGSSHQGTVTSMEPNEGTFLLHSESAKKGKIKPVHVVDVPGHSRLRPKLDEFLPQAAASYKVTAHTKEFIRKQLEKEIEKLRVSRSGVSDADIANDYTLGIPGEVFSFSQCINKVTIGEASGLTGEISQVEEFIRAHVK